jgi:hypothetical protein
MVLLGLRLKVHLAVVEQQVEMVEMEIEVLKVQKVEQVLVEQRDLKELLIM